MVFAEYDVSDAYYDWCSHHNIRTCHVFPPMRFEEEIIDVGVTSHTWRSRVCDEATGAQLITRPVKSISVDLKTRKPVEVAAREKRIAEKYYAETGRRKLRIKREGVSREVMEEKYEEIFSKEVTITEKNIDENNHVNYLAYSRFAITTLLEAIKARSPTVAGVRIKNMLVVYEGESLLGDVLALKVSRFKQSGVKRGCSTDAEDFVVEVIRSEQRLTFCQFSCVFNPASAASSNSFSNRITPKL